MNLSGQRILVTGGAGFIGSHLVDTLIERGLEVVVLDNFRNGHRENLAVAAKSPLLKIINGDITDPLTCQRACRGVDRVFHLACLGVRHSLHNPGENHQVNAYGTLNMLEAARMEGVKRFLYTSTSEVYGRATDFPITESTTTWPLTVYGASKLAGEHYTQAYFECYRLPTICVRPFNNFGPRSHFEGDTGEVIPRFILRALTGKSPVIFGDGSHTRDFFYVRECTRALVQIVETDQLIGQLVNLGYGREVSIQELAEAVLQATGRTDLKIQHDAPRPADIPRLWVNVDKLRSVVDFKTKMTLLDGLVHTTDYFRDVLNRNPDCVDLIIQRNWEV
ncbi:MAG: NAD-dependent epimerase/dehydratase family protein [Verrucomicrobia bacterium]|nr:NAD-dependent epimerase/dehydratase family protein [Verrucomicrobiota bacterium]